MRWARIEGEAFDSQGNFKKLIGMLFLWAHLSDSGALAVLRRAGDLAEVAHAATRTSICRFRPPVSVIIAAYNEEKVIVRTVRSDPAQRL